MLLFASAMDAADSDKVNDENEEKCLKLNIFQIDSYNSKPRYGHDHIFSAYRRMASAGLATVVRIFGSTDNGIKVCLHVHQYLPHFSIRMTDLAFLYGLTIDDNEASLPIEVVDNFIYDLEKLIKNKIVKDDDVTQTEPEEHYIFDVKSYSSRSIYGFHANEEIFYKFFFYSPWILDIARSLLLSGHFNGHPLLPYNCLEFLLQFYVDNQIYLNTIYLRKVTFRRTSIFTLNAVEDATAAVADQEKLHSLSIKPCFNEFTPTSGCLLEWDVCVNDIVHFGHKAKYPENVPFRPSLPGIVNLWNEQYVRLRDDYGSFVASLDSNSSRPTAIHHEDVFFKQMLQGYIDQRGSDKQASKTLKPLADATITSDTSEWLSSIRDKDEDQADRSLEDIDLLDIEFENVEHPEMTFTQQELNLPSDNLPVNFPLQLAYMDEQAEDDEEEDVDDFQVNRNFGIPQLDGPEDVGEHMDVPKNRETHSNQKRYIVCKNGNKQNTIDLTQMQLPSVNLLKLPLESLISNKHITISAHLQELITSTRTNIDNVANKSDCTELTKASPTDRSDSLYSFYQNESSQVQNNSSFSVSLSKDKGNNPMCDSLLHSTPHSSAKKELRMSSNKKHRKRSFQNISRIQLNNISETEMLQCHSIRENLKFVLSQNTEMNSQLNIHQEISSLISANSTEHSYDRFSIQMDTPLKWSQCLEMSVISLELHIQTKPKLSPNPQTDPIVVCTFAVYNELLRDNTLSEEIEGNVSPENNVSTKFHYIGMIIVKQNARVQRKVVTINRKQVHLDYVHSEAELFVKIVYYVRRFDPDILVGYVVDTLSWGYLLQRSIVLDLNVINAISRIDDQWCKTGKNSAGGPNNPPQLVGRILLNLWTLMRHELQLRDYTFENVYWHLLKERIASYSFHYLTKMWNKAQASFNERTTALVLEYYLTRATGTHKMLHQLNFIRRTYDLSCLFGMRFEDVLNRGSQYRVESMLFPLAKLENFIPIRFNAEWVSKQAAHEYIPLVFEPQVALHNEPVAVLDFQSLYPSVMIAYNYCYTTCLGKVHNIVRSNSVFGCNKLNTDRKLLKTLRKDLHISPNGVAFVKDHVRRGILPKMVEHLLYTRILVKKELKQLTTQLSSSTKPLTLQEKCKMKSLKQKLEVCQLGLKLIANVTYGYTSANLTGRMPCVEIADSIISKGREALETSVRYINEWGQWSGTGAKVVYGDTDSVFISFPNSTLKEAFHLADVLTKKITSLNPHPMAIKLEKIYQPCLLLAKKRYCGYAFESAQQSSPNFDCKGIETVRRDTCNATAKILKGCLKILFESNGDANQMKPYIQWQVRKILLGRLSNLNDFVFAKEFWGLKNYLNQAVVPSCILARRRMQLDPLAEPKRRERVPYVVVAGSPQDRLADLVRDPQDLFEDSSLQINAAYYIQRAIFPPLARVLEGIPNFSIEQLMEWYEEVRNQRSNKLPVQFAANDNEVISKYAIRQCCVLCARKVKSSPHHAVSTESQYPLCSKCISTSQQSIAYLHDHLRSVGHKWHRVARICSHCSQLDLHIPSSTMNNRHPCTVFTCPNLARYHQTVRDYEQIYALDQDISSRIIVNSYPRGLTKKIPK